MKPLLRDRNTSEGSTVFYLSTVYSYLERVNFIQLARGTPLSSASYAQGLPWLVKGWGAELTRNPSLYPQLTSELVIVQ